MTTYKVDGLRIDAVPTIFENENFQNETQLNKTDDTYSGLIHNFTRDQPETFQYIYHLRKLLNRITEQDNKTR